MPYSSHSPATPPGVPTPSFLARLAERHRRAHRAVVELREGLFSARFFTLSVAFHIFLILTLGGAIIINPPQTVSDFTADGEGIVGSSIIDEPVMPEPAPAPALEPSTPIAQDPAPSVITANAEGGLRVFSPPDMAPLAPRTAPINPAGGNPPPANGSTGPTAFSAPPGLEGLSKEQIQAINEFTNWSKTPRGGRGTSTRERVFEFVAYLAKYEGGDWASTNVIQREQNGAQTVERITKGSLPNILYFMKRLSKGKINANPVPEPLDLSSDDIFVKRPPFIFFTGHRDFVLTEREVDNLRKYVSLGGCIWGDSSLPGHRSRFDIAFRREMRRVLPDADKQWEPLPPSHPMFTRNLYYPEAAQPQPGVNGYKEPVYALRFAGEVAVIYTPNDYGDMWKMALTERLEFDYETFPRTSVFRYSDNAFYNNRELYFRNVDLPATINSYKFGTNVVIHLLTRWEDRLKGVQGL